MTSAGVFFFYAVSVLLRRCLCTAVCSWGGLGHSASEALGSVLDVSIFKFEILCLGGHVCKLILLHTQVSLAMSVWHVPHHMVPHRKAQTQPRPVQLCRCQLLRASCPPPPPPNLIWIWWTELCQGSWVS